MQFNQVDVNNFSRHVYKAIVETLRVGKREGKFIYTRIISSGPNVRKFLKYYIGGDRVFYALGTYWDVRPLKPFRDNGYGVKRLDDNPVVKLTGGRVANYPVSKLHLMDALRGNVPDRVFQRVEKMRDGGEVKQVYSWGRLTSLGGSPTTSFWNLMLGFRGMANVLYVKREDIP
jgi:hypothetical protein